MPFVDQLGTPVGKNGNDLAPHGANASFRVPHQGHAQQLQPVWLHQDVVVHKHQNFAASFSDRAIARVIQALQGFVHISRSPLMRGKTLNHRAGMIRRVVVDDDYLERPGRELLSDQPG
ncbi:MAG: hypothetical protein RIQ93_1231 [Verrucomicrobiota bacterium]